MLTIGHKGADALATGNTLESFAAAAEAGVDAIEFDVLRPREDFDQAEDWRAAPAGPADAGGPLIVAHDWGDARRRDPITLADALDALTRPPLDHLRFDLDLKVAGREDEVAAAIAERGLGARAMVSTMEVSSLVYLRDAAPELDRGWTLPKVSRDWSRSPWLRPVFYAGSASLRARLPALVRRRAPELGVWAVWIYHPLITGRLVAAAHEAGVQVIAWTVDESERIERLAALGVDGICTNDPRLLSQGTKGSPRTPGRGSSIRSPRRSRGQLIHARAEDVARVIPVPHRARAEDVARVIREVARRPGVRGED